MNKTGKPSSKKFNEFLKLYEGIKPSVKNRELRYRLAENLYFGKHGKDAYFDFRIFEARLSIHYASASAFIGTNAAHVPYSSKTDKKK